MPVPSERYIGRYRLLNLVRSGKTCQVWEVMNDIANQRLAIKLLLADYRRNREEVGFMRHEFQVGRSLEHRRVIKIYEFGVDGDNIFVAMELFAAPNLKQIIQQDYDSLPPVMRDCIVQAAEGLNYFHSQGWIHRDIKPDNFLMKPNGDVKLIDFALAIRQRGALLRFLTRSSKIQGTRSYMSPEQIRGAALDARADIYSFGCVLFELLTGKLPFTGSSTAELLNKHLKAAAPSVQAGNRNVSDGVAQLIKRMLSKLPAGRPKSMQDVLSEFHGLELFKTPPTANRR